MTAEQWDNLVNQERQRQIKEYGCDCWKSQYFMLTVLVEELGEVSKAMLEGTDPSDEIIQVGATCKAIWEWVNNICYCNK